MPRLGEIAPQSVSSLEQYLSVGVNDAIRDVCESLNKFDSLPYATIPGFLNERGLEVLSQLRVPANSKCSRETLLAHPLAGPLAETMGKISLANMDLRHRSTRTTISLRNETGENVRLEPHRDLLDGHAVLFNYGVLGNLFYILGGERRKLSSNEMVILNGAAEWGDITNFLPGKEASDPYSDFRSLGGVTMAHSVEGEGRTSRHRLLAYAEGRDTLTTQIPPELPSWF